VLVHYVTFGGRKLEEENSEKGGSAHG
jgi:hypothetical protein